MKKLPVGLQDFRYLRENDFVYVDKTSFLYQMIDSGKFFFLSRPRRFGKSLTVSTLKYLFQGEKALFQDTWIYGQWDWDTRYPVVHISMTEVDTHSPDSVIRGLLFQIQRIADSFGISLKQDHYKYAFSELLEKLARKERIVLLIDEYDKPILDHLHEPAQADAIRGVLRSFYSTVKDADPFLRFVFITGITKFTKAGVFSTLNNLADLTFRKAYATMLGYTQQELEDTFREYIHSSCEALDMAPSDLIEKIRRYYNGFSFDGQRFVYNPFSILSFFSESEFKNYWFESGSPYFLGQYIRAHQIEFDKLTDHSVTESIFSGYEIETSPPESFLVQSGYLTFKGFHEKKGYSLDFPNQEVKDAFSQLILLHQYKIDPKHNDQIRDRIVDGFEARDFSLVFAQMQQVFSAIPYPLYLNREEKKDLTGGIERLERYYHVVLLTLLWGCGIDAVAEEPSNLGRSDLAIRYGQDVWILELKKAPNPQAVKGSAQRGLEQIKEKGYGARYKDRSLFLVGIGIDGEKRNLGCFAMETVGL